MSTMRETTDQILMEMDALIMEIDLCNKSRDASLAEVYRLKEEVRDVNSALDKASSIIDQKDMELEGLRKKQLNDTQKFNESIANAAELDRLQREVKELSERTNTAESVATELRAAVTRVY